MASTGEIEARMERRNRKAYLMAGFATERVTGDNQYGSWYSLPYQDRDAMMNVEWGICFRDPHAKRCGRR